VMLKSEAADLIIRLRELNYGITIMNAEGATGKVKVLLSIIKRKDLVEFIHVLNQYNPQTFYTIEEVRSVNEGVFRASSKKHIFRFHQMIRKHK